ncbi:uncharacterized protein DSM5745_08405 [Aspergillus mulundensis]|uniref:Helicase ATP-binding domain-containing protein n=1 Tax=Aspergillus mulundensis TaxID=1810919 RepID=A0A3D8RAJ9_9EURO|nr:hypothetical protein DSM5745_08405 [Aspergillus mulundensis]RDW70894.1 hypothetical protein DSM5745_08405 [Aspergillus mulundensis]
MNDKSPKRTIWEAEDGSEEREERDRSKRFEATTSLRPPRLFSSPHNSPSPSPLSSPFILSPFIPSTGTANSPSDRYVDEPSNEPPLSTVGRYERAQGDGAAGGITAEPEDACFGMLCEVKARLKDDARIAESTSRVARDGSGEEMVRLTMVQRDNHLALQFSSGVDIAVLNTRVTQTIHGLDKLCRIEYDLLVEGKELAGAISTWMSSGKAVDFNVEIVISGPSVHRDEIGSILSHYGFYLQVPRYNIQGRVYDNPHVWDLGQSTEVLQIQSCSNGGQSLNIVAEASSFLDTLDQSTLLGAAQIDKRVTQRLLSHQRTGVDFIAQREGWQPSTSFALWHTVTKGKTKYYEHKITGARNISQPQDKAGGILADQMGLGKTLTILSAIVGSLGLARLWATSEPSTSLSKVGATLVIVPSETIISQWKREIASHLAAHSIRIMKYHGSNRAHGSSNFAACEIVLSTYATVSAEFRAGASRLHAVQWFRVVLDEAHNIRDSSTAQFRAVASLPAQLRWCLTGTPIQNSLQDLGSLVRFLRISQLDSNPYFRQHITTPVEKGQAVGLTNLKILLRSICLRRTKELLKLPEPERTIHEVKLSLVETSEYSRIIEQVNLTVETAVSEGRPADARRAVFKMILKLRLLCTLGTFYRAWEAYGEDATSQEERFALLQQSDEAKCAVCSCDILSIDDPTHQDYGVFTQCHHLLCLDCFGQCNENQTAPINKIFTKRPKKQQCPICGKSGKREKTNNQDRFKPTASNIANLGQSEKLSCLMSDISVQCRTDKM